MSLSNLQSQLAALHDNTNAKHAGTHVTTSTRHEVGRGTAFSAQLGHSLHAASGSGSKYQPTVVYRSAAAAADVPLSTIVDEATQAGELLTGMEAALRVPLETLLNSMELEDESKQKKMEAKHIRSTLIILSTLLVEGSSSDDDDHDTPVYTACCQVLEFLLRRYLIHVHYKVDLLWAVWPGAEDRLAVLRRYNNTSEDATATTTTSPNLLQQCLRLCDWTTADVQSYLWLRPYAGKEAQPTKQHRNNNNNATTTTTTVHLPPRRLLAQQCRKHGDVLRSLLDVTLRTAALFPCDDNHNNHHDPSLPRPGVALVLSFTATVLVQCLASCPSAAATLDSTNAEAMVRACVPVLIQAVSPSSNQHALRNPDFVAWGYVVASALTETFDVTPVVRNQWMAMILKGAVPTREGQAQAVACVLSMMMCGSATAVPVGSVKGNENTNNHDDGTDTYLPLLHKDTVVGCPLSTATYEALCECGSYNADDGVNGDGSGVAHLLAHLYSHRRLEVTPLVAALCCYGMSSSQRSDPAVVTALVTHPDLAGVWKDSRTDLVASVAAHCVQRQSIHQKDSDNDDDGVARTRTMLLALHRMDAASAERGVAAALKVVRKRIEGSDNDSDGVDAMNVDYDEKEDNEDRVMERLAGLLDGIVGVKETASDKSTTNLNHLLPPRVALEHKEASIRLQAAKQLIVQVNDRLAGSSDRVDPEVGTSLLRHVIDVDATVAMACAKAVSTWLEKDRWQVQSDNAARLVELGLHTIYYYLHFYFLYEAQEASEIDTSDRTAKYSLLVQSLKILACLGRGVSRLGEADLFELWFRILRTVGALLTSRNKVLLDQAERCVFVCFDRSPRKKLNREEKAEAVLTDSLPFLKSLQTHPAPSQDSLALSKRSSAVAEKARKLCIFNMLQALKKKVDMSETGQELAGELLALCLVVVGSSASDPAFATVADEECKKLKSCLTHSFKCMSDNDSVPQIIVALASCRSKRIWKAVADPVLCSLVQHVKHTDGTSVSPFALLMESVFATGTQPDLVCRLLKRAVSVAKSGDCDGSWLAVVPALALLESRHREVRREATHLLEVLGTSLPKTKGKGKDLDWSCLKEICQSVSDQKDSISLGGESCLSKLLASCLKESSHSSKVRDVLLSLCVFAVVGCGSSSTAKSATAQEKRWGSSGKFPSGGCRAACTFLSAAELAGEETFPLLQRWKLVGKPIVELLHESSSSFDDETLRLLANCSTRMMKGVMVCDPRVVISSGPNSGRNGRVRSYSIGKMDGVTMLSPYPKDMQNLIISSLQKAVESQEVQVVASVLSKEVLGSKSWLAEVFPNLPKTVRKDIAIAVLGYTSSSADDVPDHLLAHLPLTNSDIMDLIQFCSKNATLGDESLVIDFVYGNAYDMSCSPQAGPLIALLFERLKIYVSESSIKKDGAEFIIQSTLVSLEKLLDNIATEKDYAIDESNVDDWTKTLLHLMESGGRPRLQQIVTLRCKTLAVSLLVGLCSKFPDRIVASLVPAALSSIEESNSAAGTFSKVVPAFIAHAATAKSSLTPLFGAIVAAADDIPNVDDRQMIYTDLVSALIASKSNDSNVDDTLIEACTGSLQAFYLANEAYKCTKENVGTDVVDFAVTLFEPVPEKAQVSSLLQLLAYAKELLGLFRFPDVQDGNKSYEILPPTSDIGIASAVGVVSICEKADLRILMKTKKAKDGLRRAVEAILRLFSDALTLDSVRRFIRREDAEVSKKSLCLWQDLLMVQSTALLPVTKKYLPEDTSFVESVLSLVNESREYLQSIMPAPVFLASVSSLIEDGENVEIRGRALRLVAERANSVNPSTKEKYLFIDLVPVALKILGSRSLGSTSVHDDLILIQSAVVAIEHIARLDQSGISLDQRGSRKPYGFQYFITATETCARLLAQFDSAMHKKDETSTASDVFASCALCCATLIRSIGASCLPVLPRLIKSLVVLLSSANATIIRGVSQSPLLRVTQLSVLRALAAIVESVPQFLPPHLPLLLTGDVLLSKSLRCNDDEASSIAVRDEADRLNTSLSTHVASRLLVPAASRAITKLRLQHEIVLVLSVLKTTVETTASSMIGAQKDTILGTVIAAFEYDGSFDDRVLVVKSACELFDVMVLKLSEVQLRRVYSSLQSWRGDSVEEGSTSKRFAFWSVSERLSKELRSIFLPCFETAFGSLVEELNVAVTGLCQRTLEINSIEGKKKRKLDSRSYGSESIKVLLKLLCTIENVLRADAHEGGSWIRADENQKFEVLLEPLGKLLLCQIPSHTSGVSPDEDSFQSIVEGSQDAGGIVGCLTALAAAAGNEQLWKPLNHTVLNACGNESRAEVRRAGLVCLLELMKSLGEEYMVLLPENLPVLSELLEDSNEDVASLAREVVTKAEELTGESLEDSLR